ncbi:hypothetical protein BD626DRAFT_493853 [Schizophyllum amplum]|uniref:RING-type domain-containing protein n=1 Tax=Schizophyllum amplum TaxID=97359 RepID=A0A550CH59_9AGAR|nr:hypothetical protein BD626DRAFT_493853 [Auriculariopsis ampla]
MADTDLENFRRYLSQYERGCATAEPDSEVEEALQHEDSPLNLGMETPRTVASTPRFALTPRSASSRGAPSPAPEVYGDVWARRDTKEANLAGSIRRRRQSAFKAKITRETDCGICFEDATMPCRTLCCGALFCMDHIAEWLHGDESESRCPSCGAICSLSTSLAREPGLHLPIPQPPPPYPTPLPPSSGASSEASSDSDHSDHDQTGPGFSEGDDEASPVRRASPKTLSAAVREPDFAANMAGKLLSIAALLIFYYVILSKNAPAPDPETEMLL